MSIQDRESTVRIHSWPIDRAPVREEFVELRGINKAQKSPTVQPTYLDPVRIYTCLARSTCSPDIILSWADTGFVTRFNVIGRSTFPFASNPWLFSWRVAAPLKSGLELGAEKMGQQSREVQHVALEVRTGTEEDPPHGLPSSDPLSPKGNSQERVDYFELIDFLDGPGVVASSPWKFSWNDASMAGSKHEVQNVAFHLNPDSEARLGAQPVPAKTRTPGPSRPKWTGFLRGGPIIVADDQGILGDPALLELQKILGPGLFGEELAVRTAMGDALAGAA
ncbi:hypothetical protein DFH07DRAFT_769920 [Mycena maculata]|uniref:Uncharacterized protein n=1 Tax=Mycena maculata TaxID=230809 RepID=A0AAD7JLA4_9AGAR|nr:hypothetical protein DFH07DRAFT_769920 [Mycena maculata]